jgi:hypothetical protein
VAEPILTPEAQQQLIQAWIASQAKGGSPTAPAPATQQYLARWDENRIDEATGQKAPGFVFYTNPNYTPPKSTATQGAVTGSQYGTWEPDPANPGQYRQVVPPQAGISDPNEARSKAIKAQTDEADRDRRIANERTTGLYVDDKTLADIQHASATDTVAAARLVEDIRNNTANQKLADDKLHLENQKLLLDIAKNPAEIAKLGAEAGKIGAETDLTKAQIATLGIKTASDVDRARAAGQLDQAQADRIKAELARGEAVTAPLDQPFLTRRDATGQLITEQNPNYQGPKAPTTRGELAQRVAMFQTQANEMRNKIEADPSIPKDQQSDRFLKWYDQQIAPQVGALEQQYQAIATDEAQKAIEQQRANVATAASAFQGTLPYRVGPNYGKTLEGIWSDSAQAAGLPKRDFTGAATFQAPSLDEHIQNLLKGVSPTAAAATGGPPPAFGAVDVRSQLDANRWLPGGMPPSAGAGPPPGAPVPPPVAPPGTPAGAEPMPWQRADQWATQMPPGGPPLPPPGSTGTVPWGDPRYVGLPPQRPPLGAWSQSMPNFGNPQLINPYAFPG